jgi:predicted ArsR family transcriptional regulator
MFDEILSEIEKAKGPVTVKELAEKLDIEQSALEKMLEFLEKKGKLEIFRPAELDEGCGSISCTACVFGGNCPVADKGGTG